ncbi:MAG: hypothetical protein IJR70_05860 [Eubacterium sp.]|nr:hypothetical protein [Eubacterium sp.]
MNNQRRKELDNIYNDLESIKYRLEDVLSEEETCLYNIPENLQASERYETAEDACEAISSAVDSIDEIFVFIEQARGR